MKVLVGLCLALLASVPACMTQDNRPDPEPFFGDTFEAQHRPDWQVSCPVFENIHPTLSDLVVIEPDSVTFSGKDAYDVVVGPLDEWGIAPVTFTVDRTWALGSRPVPVSIRFTGHAQKNDLSFKGSVRFPTDQPDLKYCAMSMYLMGWEATPEDLNGLPQ